MRILLITSLYSGIKKSILSGDWHPEGMPAIYKLLDGLRNENIDFDYVLTDYANTSPKTYSNKLFTETKFIVFASIVNKLPKNIITDILFVVVFAIWSIFNIKVSKYDLVYLDRANVVLAPLFICVYKKKVILRIHGVGKLPEKMKVQTSLMKYGFRKWSYNSEFHAVICTQDGSPGSYFIEKYIRRAKDKYLWLNGTDVKKQDKKKRNENHLTLLYVSRLERDKGILEIIEFIREYAGKKTEIILEIIGTGTYSETIKKLMLEYNNIKYHGAMQHADVVKYYSKCDVVLSLNSLGNLNNVVLEAVAAGIPVITFESEKSEGVDVDTERILNDSAIYINRNNVVYELVKNIDEILKNPSILEYKTNKCNEATSVISWDERIEREIKLLKSVIL